MRFPIRVVALAMVLAPCAAYGQNPAASSESRSAPCWQVPMDQSSRCIEDALSLVRWRLDEFIKQRGREHRGVDTTTYYGAALVLPHRRMMDSLRVIQQHWQLYVEGHCRQVVAGTVSEALREKGCLVDAYDRRLAELLPMICETSVFPCPMTEEFERRHSRH